MNVEINFEICFLACFALSLKYCLADSLEDYKLKYVNNILECSKEFPITSEDILKLRKKELPAGDNVKCLLACSYKKSGMMDADGKLSPEGIQKISDEVFADQPELKKRSDDFTNACKFAPAAVLQAAGSNSLNTSAAGSSSSVFTTALPITSLSVFGNGRISVLYLFAIVNDENITGDKKDCERAAMIFKCSVERAAEFDFTA